MKFYEVKDHDGVTVDCHFSKKVANIAADEINGTVSMIDVDVTAENMRRLIGNIGGYANEIKNFG